MQICHYLYRTGHLVLKIPKAGYFDARKGVERFKKHISPYAVNGVADLYAVIDGQSIWIEVKSKRGVQSDAQKEFERLLKENRVPYYLVRCLEDVFSIVETHKKPKKFL